MLVAQGCYTGDKRRLSLIDIKWCGYEWNRCTFAKRRALEGLLLGGDGWRDRQSQQGVRAAAIPTPQYCMALIEHAHNLADFGQVECMWVGAAELREAWGATEASYKRPDGPPADGLNRKRSRGAVAPAW
jgi:hypothetical protein